MDLSKKTEINKSATKNKIALDDAYIETEVIMTGFVLLLEVLEKPWNLILDFKGA